MYKERLVKESETSFILPKEGDMLVPGRLLLSDSLLEHVEEGAVEQVRNAACIPGIVGHSLAMPDMHIGYGFTVGGISAFRTDSGVVSPGAIGFDINCLDGSTRILTRDGYTRPIKSFEDDFEEELLPCLHEGGEEFAKPMAFMYKRADKPMYRVTTSSGKELVVSDDHPLQTPSGMVPVGELARRDSFSLAINPFEGVDYEQPSSEVLVTEEDVYDRGISQDPQTVAFLKKQGLLPLRADSKHIGALLRIMGFVFGDGVLTATERTCRAAFYGEKEDLELLRTDVRSLGFSPSTVYSRTRDHRIDTSYGRVSFTATEHSFGVSAKSFVTLLALLGVPVGNKTRQAYSVPRWVREAPLWQQRLFLAAYFGAEMTTPATMKGHDKTFLCPTVSVNKSLPYMDSGRDFLEQVTDMLGGFGVSCAPVVSVDEHTGRGGVVSRRLRLQVYADSWNLLRLFERVNFEYCQRKRVLANAAVAFLTHKEQVITHRCVAQKHALVLYETGSAPQQIFADLSSDVVNERFLQRSIYSGRKSLPRVPRDFVSFEEFFASATQGLGSSGYVWDEVVSCEVIEGYDELVYDFSMNHEAHNFVANSFIVSNCGVRVLATDVEASRVEDFIEELLELLAERVPAGVGLKSSISLSASELDEVLLNGSRWCLDKGFALEEDVVRTEEGGCFSEAVPSKVSHQAKARGRNQLGTLGGGNHFLEVQVVDEIFDEAVASQFGVSHEGQVLVMIHCGSRGLGHQVCTDYLRRIEKEFPDLMASLPEKNLAYAPAGSKLASDYWGAMQAAANFAFANRQVIAHQVRGAFERLFPGCSVKQVYDIAHNVAKREVHVVDGEEVELFVHRKGATRAFPAGREEVCAPYRSVGQPVLIPGSMGTSSYILVGTERALSETFGSSAHGAGRLMSRTQAKKDFSGSAVTRELRERSIFVHAASAKGVAEEAPGVYKDVDEVIRVTEDAGVAKKVVRARPLGVVKG